MTKIVIIRLRGTDDVNGRIEDTMRMLKLFKKHTCSIYTKTDSLMGMLEKIKDYTTYGELDDETHKLLVEKRGSKAVTPSPKSINSKNVNSDDKPKKEAEVFHLHPPRGGFGGKGIKTPFSMKGALGYRGVKINDLIKKML